MSIKVRVIKEEKKYNNHHTLDFDSPRIIMYFKDHTYNICRYKPSHIITCRPKDLNSIIISFQSKIKSLDGNPSPCGQFDIKNTSIILINTRSISYRRYRISCLKIQWI